MSELKHPSGNLFVPLLENWNALVLASSAIGSTVDIQIVHLAPRTLLR